MEGMQIVAHHPVGVEIKSNRSIRRNGHHHQTNASAVPGIRTNDLFIGEESFSELILICTCESNQSLLVVSGTVRLALLRDCDFSPPISRGSWAFKCDTSACRGEINCVDK